MHPSKDFVAETKRRAEAGEAAAQVNLGLFYCFGKGVHRDQVEAVRWFRRAAEQGDAQAQYNLGIAYDTGDGVGRDVREAFRWFLRAANQGHAEAQFNVGICYGRGDGVAEDQVEFIKWMHLSAAGGYAKGVEVLDIARQQYPQSLLTQAERCASQWLPMAELALDQQLRPGFRLD